MSSTPSSKTRIREIDLLRGIAVILMVVYHFVFNLHFLGVKQFSLKDFPWVQIAQIVQCIFIASTGFTFAISSNRHKQIRHIGVLTLCAVGISLVTSLLFGDAFVRFGILHFFATAMLLSLALKKFTSFNAWLGLFFLGLWPILNFFFLGRSGMIPLELPSWLLPIYLPPDQFKTLDYFPLIPWYGLFLEGIFLGNFFKKSKYFKNYSPLISISWLEKIGSHSLIIYLIHQPLLVALIYLGIYLKII